MRKYTVSDFAEYPVVFLTGGLLYGAIEIGFRGHTHWSMLITGGACLAAFHYACKRLKRRNIFIKCLAGCLIITLFEFIAGCVVNLVFNLGVWDYSGRFLNICGQICPLFSLFWFLLCLPAALLCNLLSRLFARQRDEESI